MKKQEVKSQLEFYPVEQNSQLRVNIVEAAKVHAGFPSPVQDAYMNPPIDLNQELVTHPATTFVVRVVGDSMIDEGIDSGDLLLVEQLLVLPCDQVALLPHGGLQPAQATHGLDLGLGLSCGYEVYP